MSCSCWFRTRHTRPWWINKVIRIVCLLTREMCRLCVPLCRWRRDQVLIMYIVVCSIYLRVSVSFRPFCYTYFHWNRYKFDKYQGIDGMTNTIWFCPTRVASAVLLSLYDTSSSLTHAPIQTTQLWVIITHPCVWLRNAYDVFIEISVRCLVDDGVPLVWRNKFGQWHLRFLLCVYLFLDTQIWSQLIPVRWPTVIHMVE